ncbi:MAG: alkaline phosphatase PhoX [Gemmatimonadota bacterium]
MPVSRRDFLRRTIIGSGALFAPSLSGLAAFNGLRAAPHAEQTVRHVGLGYGGYGELVPSLDAPELFIPIDFRCVRLSTTLSPSLADPGFIVPQAFDGMAAFALPNGNIRLVRNQEINDPITYATPFGQRPYDRKAGGGTTSLEVEVQGSGSERSVRLVREFASLSGTHVNCAGGATPWGSWLSCEETTDGQEIYTTATGATAGGRDRDHGYVFEVPASAEEEVEPVPLKAMGRFVHEAIAVDPATGIVYETEDRTYDFTNSQALPGAGFYRFIPAQPANLNAGGKLQMLAIAGRPNYMTMIGQKPGAILPAIWVDIDDPDPKGANRDSSAVFRQGYAKGAAVFQRLEGCFYADRSIFFDSTSGGDVRAGQVWQYRPTSNDGGQLILVFESPSCDVLDAPDNICISRRGGIVICEDGTNDQYIRGLTPNGGIFNLVHQPSNRSLTSEFAGSCFSPDGEILFFNTQGSTSSRGARLGGTYAMWGPWERGGL